MPLPSAAKEYAAGHYDYPMPTYTGHDQADLAGAIKYLADKMKDTNDYQKNFIANVSHDLLNLLIIFSHLVNLKIKVFPLKFQHLI